jgi:hypothetical protein
MAPTNARERRIATVTSLALTVCLLVAFISGVALAVSDALLGRSDLIAGLHQVSSYMLLGLASLHVYFHRRTLVGQVRKWILGTHPSAPTRMLSAPGRRGAIGCEREARVA